MKFKDYIILISIIIVISLAVNFVSFMLFKKEVEKISTVEKRASYSEFQVPSREEIFSISGEIKSIIGNLIKLEYTTLDLKKSTINIIVEKDTEFEEYNFAIPGGERKKILFTELNIGDNVGVKLKEAIKDQEKIPAELIQKYVFLSEKEDEEE